jgi:beta-glucosidase
MMADKFLWGVSTSGFQVEGHNNDVKSLWPSNNGVDFFKRYAEYIDLAKDLGVTSFRLSIEWARLEPEEGNFDPEGIGFYTKVFEYLKHKEMEPLVTLIHFNYPRWIVEKHFDLDNEDPSGMVRPSSSGQAPFLRHFNTYVKKVVSLYGKYVKYWLTFNEPNTWVIGAYQFGAVPPKRTGTDKVNKAKEIIIEAHRQAYDTIHNDYKSLSINIDPQVSLNAYWIATASNMLKEHLGENLSNLEKPDLNFIDDLKQTVNGKVIDYVDYISFDYYYFYSSVLSVIDITNPLNGFMTTDWDKQYFPEGFRTALKYCSIEWPGKPIIIAENGICKKYNEQTNTCESRRDGWSRSAALVQTLKAMFDSINIDKVKVIGYFYWTLIDNYELGSFTPRYGLYTLKENKGIEPGNPDTLKDFIAKGKLVQDEKDLFYPGESCVTIFKNIITRNSVSPELVSKYKN